MTSYLSRWTKSNGPLVAPFTKTFLVAPVGDAAGNRHFNPREADRISVHTPPCREKAGLHGLFPRI